MRDGAASTLAPAWRDVTLPAETRARALVDALTLDEKIGQLMMQCPALPRLGIPAYDWWSEGLHGVARNGLATVFPQAIGLAATWNPTLVGLVADAIAAEARAKYHEQLRRAGETGRYQGLTLWSPNINLFRDPRWGRGQECYGEDVLLTSRLGTAFVRGLQGDDPERLRTVATPKHFALHNGPERGRLGFDVRMSGRDAWEEELSAFEFVLRDGAAASVMSAYNAINGTPCAANRWLLTSVLRERWGFRGAVVGDVDNVAHLSGAMGFAPDDPTACALALRAGQDLCSGWAFQRLGEAVVRGLITEAEIDENLTRNLAVRVRLGQFDSVAETSVTPAVVDCPAHDHLALQAARASLVLLKNDGVLPLDVRGLRRVAVLGPTADNHAALLGNYHGVPARPVTLLDGLKRRLEPLGIAVAHRRSVPLVPGLERLGVYLHESRLFFADTTGRQPGLSLEVTHADTPCPPPTAETPPVGFNLFWNIYMPVAPIPPELAGLKWSGYMVPDQSGHYRFTIEAIGGFSLSIAGQTLAAEFAGDNIARRRTHHYTIALERAQPVPIAIEFRQTALDALFAVSLQTPSDPVDDLASAMALARDSDCVVLALGLTPEVEGEEMPVDFPGFVSGDRTTLHLPAPQRELLAQVRAVARRVIVVLMTGSAVIFDPEAANAALVAWYYGQRGGDAIAEAILGDYNPAGRLPVTFYASDDDLPWLDDYRMDGRTYKYFAGRPLFAFGHGLSYTTFAYGAPPAPPAPAPAGNRIALEVPVTNTGQRDGEEVVQVYARRAAPLADRPRRQLVGFQRQFIAARTTATVTVTIDTRVLRRWDEARADFVHDLGAWLLEIGSASDRLHATCPLQLIAPERDDRL